MKIQRNRKDEKILSIIAYTNEKYRPVLELSENQKHQLRTAAGVALAVLAVAGAVTLSALAPNMFMAIDKVYRLTKKRKLTFKEKKEKTAQVFYYLKRQGYIELSSEKQGFLARLTQSGKRKLAKLNLETVTVRKPKNWDGKWWLVAADISTKDYRWAADLFRKKIKLMQFYPLQRTLWFYPYNPVTEIEFVAESFGIGRFVTVMEVSRLEKDDEQKLRKFFGL